jgi:hypothetical protein
VFAFDQLSPSAVAYHAAYQPWRNSWRTSPS